MVKGLVGSFQLMKSLNKSLVLNVIRTEGPISRAEIAKKTNLTPPTVTNIVGELLASQLVVESALGTSTGGRKPIPLRINAKAFQAIGIDVGVSYIKIIATALDAEIIEALQIEAPQPVTSESFLGSLKNAVHRVMEKAHLSKETIIGIGIGMHGLVNPEEGSAIFAPNLNLHHIPISKILEKEFQIPVAVENDVRAMALGESWFGHGQGVEDFVCLNVGMGVGAGIILNHKLYKGSSYTAGEFGHMTIDIEGPRCSCGNYGCLQALAAEPAIAARAQKELRRGKKSLITERVKGDLDNITGDIVYQAALQEDQLAREILRDAGRYLGIGIANIINTLNPMKVIIGGTVSHYGDLIMKPLIETVQARALETPAKVVKIQPAKLGNHAAAIGAVTLVLQKLFIPEFSKS